MHSHVKCLEEQSFLLEDHYFVFLVMKIKFKYPVERDIAYEWMWMIDLF